AAGGPGGLIQVSDRERNPALIAVIGPLPLRPASDVASGRVLIALRHIRDMPAFTEGMLTSLYRLSRSQAAIALLLYQGKTTEEIAAMRGVKISTIRTHLSEIFARTGSENQLDLIRRLSNLPPLRC